LMLLHGVPRDVTIALRAMSGQVRHWAAEVDVTHVLSDGDTLAFANRSWHVFQRPGHSPSDIVFLDEATGELLAGDHLIKHISSNPVISRPLPGQERGVDERPHALKTYLASLRATHELDLHIVYPGHGEPIGNYRELIEDRLVEHEQRAARIAELLADGPKTGYEIAQKMWGNVALTQAFLALSEVLGHIDLLMDRGQVVEIAKDGVIRHALTR
jgi:glyoxylase-like metal-dependent hydrolase (beta-lactamase superfamily II)